MGINIKALTDLTALTSLASGDFFVIDDLSTTTTKSVTVAVLSTYVGANIGTIGSLVLDDTSADHTYIFGVSELAANRTVTLPLLTGNDTFVFNDFAATLINKTLTSPILTTPQLNDTSADHQYIFAVSELAADRTVTWPLLTGNDELVFKDHAVTMSNKTHSGIFTTDDLTFAAANPEILGADVDGTMYLSADTTKDLGGNILLYGSTHASKADDIEFRDTTTVELHFDSSGSLWDFQANAVTTSGALTGGTVTSTALLTAGDLTLTAATPEILGGDVDGEIYVSADTTKDLGGNIVLYGSTHSSKAKDIEFRDTTTAKLAWDSSAAAWDFKSTTVKAVKFQNHQIHLDFVHGSF